MINRIILHFVKFCVQIIAYCILSRVGRIGRFWSECDHFKTWSTWSDWSPSSGRGGDQPDQRKNMTSLTTIHSLQPLRLHARNDEMQPVKKCKHGEQHGRAKLTDHEVELLRRMVERGELSQQQAAEKFELSKGYVSRLCRYERR